MSLESTETSRTEVPEEYGGILDPRTRGDEYGNVQMSEPQDIEEWTDKAEEGRAQPARYEFDYHRREALEAWIRVAAYIPEEQRNTTIDEVLVEVEKIANWLAGPKGE